ncbi:hypothetical protein N8D56_03170 [Devosia sp. A8/3-2]|nr:hypothetical protein N8D56_03170 [Devosia sp. A8/3-2]
MDFRISADDRVGAQPKGKPAAASRAKGGERVRTLHGQGGRRVCR